MANRPADGAASPADNGDWPDALRMQMLTVQDCADHLALAAIDGRTDLVPPFARTFRGSLRVFEDMVRSSLRAVERERDAALKATTSALESLDWIAAEHHRSLMVSEDDLRSCAASEAESLRSVLRALSPGAATTESEGRHG